MDRGQCEKWLHRYMETEGGKKSPQQEAPAYPQEKGDS